MKLTGVWLPIITPFLNDSVDFESYKNLIDCYIPKGISGIMPLGTTGEGPTISESEFEELVEKTMEYVNGRVPVFIGLGGNNTLKVVKQVKTLEKYMVNGILSVSPYYSRPDQRGIYEHFLRISEATDLDIVVYNIPYRTGRNIENSTIHKLAELKNLVGIKDSCGDIKQSTELLLNPPKNFSILTGEDVLFYTTLLLGGHGGILASSHIRTEDFVQVYKDIQNNDHKAALEKWRGLHKFIPMLFEEPNPAPIKYYLHKHGLIKSSEVRLPLMDITDNLKKRMDLI
ncbi:MAG: 4-hydroxy-tetrahydrodipicolinate synthase [Bacillota bacterium]|nr:4-hydroxy-tetrahydrodipicolinate synthase [Bacillota bacterium]